MTWSHSLCETVGLIVDGRFSGGTWDMVVGGRWSAVGLVYAGCVLAYSTFSKSLRGGTEQTMLAHFPDLEPEDIRACLHFGAQRSDIARLAA